MTQNQDEIYSKYCPVDYNEIGYIVGKDLYNENFCSLITQNEVENTHSNTEFKSFGIWEKDDMDSEYPLYITTFADNQAKNKLGYDLELNLLCSRDDNKIIGHYDDIAKKYIIQVHDENVCNKYVVSPPQISTQQLVNVGNLGFFEELGWVKWIVGPIIALLGLYLCLLGHRFLKVNLIIIGFLTGFLAAYIVLSLIIDTNTSSVRRWILFGISVFVGCSMGFAFYCIEKLALIGAGVYLGIISGFLLYSLGIYELDAWEGTTSVWLWIICIVLACLLGYLALKLHNIIWILSTSLGGSYLCVKSAGKLIGGYPDEVSLATQVEDQAFGNVEVGHWIYLGITLGLFLTGIVFQCIHLRKIAKLELESKENEQHYYRAD